MCGWPLFTKEDLQMTNTVSADYEIETMDTRVAFHLPDTEDHIQKYILRNGTFYEQEMLAEIGPLVPDDSLIVDAGANIGNHTVFFAKVLGAKVLSCEPNPAAIRVLKRNVELNGLQDRVELYEVALGSGTGRGRVLDVEAHNAGMAQVLVDDSGDVEIRSLDEIVGERFVHLIKIDVEGMESDVLRGAKGTLERCSPHLVVEAGTVEGLEQIEAVVRPMGYRKFKVYNHTPTYLFKKVFAGGSLGGSVVESISPHIRVKLPKTEGIYAGMATVVGNETALRAGVVSLLPQVDRLYIYLNGFEKIPEFLNNNPRVSCHIDTDGRKYGDAGKFWGLEQVRDGIYLTCDDDVIYPENYVEQMVAELAFAGANSVVAVHGSLLLSPNNGYYKEAGRAVFHFRQALLRKRRIHIAATIACAFHTETVRMTLEDFEHPNMADIWLARYLQDNRIPVYAVPRPSNWLIPLEVNRQTIYEQSSRASGSHYDTSRIQDKILAGMQPISLLGVAPSTPAFILDIARGIDIPSILADINFGTRDPIIFVICDQIDEELRKAVLERGIRYEIHFLTHSGTFVEAYRSLLMEAVRQGNIWRFMPGIRPDHLRITDFEGWLSQTFGSQAD